MKVLGELVQIPEAGILCCFHRITDQISKTFSPGLRSDVLTPATENIQLQTGLANIQTFGTAEMVKFIKIKRDQGGA
ncbi:MAG: hypothetical protein WCL21_10280 [Mariniphaga sp.]